MGARSAEHRQVYRRKNLREVTGKKRNRIFLAEEIIKSIEVYKTVVGGNPDLFEKLKKWLGGRDSNPDMRVQSPLSYR